ncbi:MAG: helix-hairpin-helix domain-containing protein, partial [Ilumatobacteraceae bacterium]
THHENQRVDLNSASVEQLANLPMFGQKRAEELVKSRPFWDVRLFFSRSRRSTLTVVATDDLRRRHRGGSHGDHPSQ